jgi:hypothetical protein
MMELHEIVSTFLSLLLADGSDSDKDFNALLRHRKLNFELD